MLEGKTFFTIRLRKEHIQKTISVHTQEFSTEKALRKYADNAIVFSLGKFSR